MRNPAAAAISGDGGERTALELVRPGAFASRGGPSRNPYVAGYAGDWLPNRRESDAKRSQVGNEHLAGEPANGLVRFGCSLRTRGDDLAEVVAPPTQGVDAGVHGDAQRPARQHFDAAPCPLAPAPRCRHGASVRPARTTFDSTTDQNRS
jgi:hypothetical protein